MAQGKKAPKELDDLATQYPAVVLAKMFNVTAQTISNARKRQNASRNPKRSKKCVRSACYAVRNALRSGKLVRPKCCESCGGKETFNKRGYSLLEAHHDDYSKPLEVRWLCKTCHRHWHQYNDAKNTEAS